MPAIDDVEFRIASLLAKMGRIDNVAKDFENNSSDIKKINLLRAMTYQVDSLLEEFNEGILKLASLYAKQSPPVEKDKELRKSTEEFEAMFFNTKAILLTYFPDIEPHLRSTGHPATGESNTAHTVALP